MALHCPSARKAVWKHYVSVLKTNQEALLRSSLEGYEDLTTSLLASLQILEEHRATKLAFSTAFSFYEMHRSLSIFKTQDKVPSTVLCRLWGFEKKENAVVVMRALAGVGLAELSLDDRQGEWFLSWHDLIHQFALASVNRRRNEKTWWHQRLLEQYYPSKELSHGEDLDNFKELEESKRIREKVIFGIKSSHSRETLSRPWWNASDDGYIHSNVIRHLVASGSVEEAVGLLCDICWTRFRHKRGGLRGWSNDFESFWCAVKQEGFASDEEQCLVSELLTLVKEAVIESWGLVAKNLDELSFQLHARLQSITEATGYVQSYLNSAKADFLRPMLLPVSRIWPLPGKGWMKAEIPFEQFIGEAELREDSTLPVGYPRQRHSGANVVAIPRSSSFIAVALHETIYTFDWRTCEIIGTLRGHTGTVLALSITPCDRFLVSGAADATARVWNLFNCKQDRELSGHDGAITCLTIAPEGDTVISGSQDGTIRLWNLLTGSPIGTPLCAHEGGVSCVGISSDGKRICSAGADKKLCIWELRTLQRQKLLRLSSSHECEATCLAIASKGTEFVTGSLHGSLRVWKVSAGADQEASLEGHSDLVTCAATTQDGNYLVSASSNGELRLWNMLTRKQVGETLHCGRGSLISVTIAPDRGFVVTVSKDTIRIWGPELFVGSNRGMTESQGFVYCAVIAAHSKKVVTTERRMPSYDNVITARDIESPDHTAVLLQRDGRGVSCLGISSYGRYAAAWFWDHTVQVYNRTFGTQDRVLFHGHDSHVICGAIAEDGSLIASASADNEVIVLHVGSTMQQCKFSFFHRIPSLAITPDGERIIVHVRDTIQVWNVMTSESVGIPQRTAVIDRIEVCMGGIVKSYSKGVVTCWRLDGDAGLLRVSDKPALYCYNRYVRSDERVLATLPASVGESAWCYQDNHRVLVTGLTNGQLLFHDLLE